MTYDDIQIGDWVYFSSTSKYPMKVTYIDPYECGLTFDGNEGDDMVGIYGEDGIQPIPLTEDMLILNDGKFETPADDMQCYKFNQLRVDLRFGAPMVHIGSCMQIIHYVHTLQNLLRICGGRAYANNFKIK